MRTIINRILKGIIIFLTTLLFSLTFVYIISFFLGPPNIAPEKNTVIFDHSGQKVIEWYGDENRSWVTLDEISPYAIEAMIVIEDQHFYTHNGFDFKGILRAIWKNIKSFSLKEGASTITQQYARNLFLSHEKTWTRKLKEAFYTIRLEMYYSKEEILEGYLNMIYFGHGAYGIEAASQFYFAKQAKDLTLAEAALLIAIPKGPTYYSPLNDLAKAKSRQQIILEKLIQQQLITPQQYKEAVSQDFHFQQKKSSDEPIGHFFIDAVMKETQKILDTDPQIIRSNGYKIYTTLDIKAQRKLEETIDQHFSPTSELQVAAMAMNPLNGAISSIVGGRDYEESSFNRAISAKRMAGSTFKPFLYYAALENNYTATTTLLSQPTSFRLGDGEVYQPSNYNGYYADQPITLAEALAVSDNIYAVKTNMFLGSERLIKTAKRFGIKSDLPSVPSLALGTASVSLLEMVTAYGILANGGEKIKGYTVQKIIDRYGHVIYERKKQSQQITLDRNYAFILTNLLMGMFDVNLNGYTTVTGSSIADQLTRPYAGKSGTTSFDSWMIGYSPSIVFGIWTGYDDHRTMDIVEEKRYAKNIWAQYMEEIHQGKPLEDFVIPEDVIGLPIDPETGKISTPFCPSDRTMYFLKGTEPQDYCTVHFPTKVHKENFKENLPSPSQGFFKRLLDLFKRD